MIKKVLFRAMYITYSVLTYVLPYRTRRVRCLIHADDGRLVLVTHTIGSNRWGLPGGGMKRGESPELASIRELNEELSVEENDIETIQHLGTVTKKYGLGRFTFEITEVKLHRHEFTKLSHEIDQVQKFEVDEVDWGETDILVREALALAKIKT